MFKDVEGERGREASRVPAKGPERTMLNEITSKRTVTRQPGISRADVDNVSRQIEKLGKQLEELKKRGEIVSQNRNSPFTNRIHLEVVDNSF